MDGSDQIIVVWEADETSESWVEYVSSERYAPLENEKLWALPQNWTQQYIVEGSFDSFGAIYTVEGEQSVVDDIAVFVNYTGEVLPIEKPFEIMAVGRLSHTLDEELTEVVNWHTIFNTAGHLQLEDVESDVGDLLRELHRSSDDFEINYVGELSLRLEDAVTDMYQPPNAELPSWTVTPIHQPEFIDDVIQNVTDSSYEKDTRESVIDILYSEGVISQEHPVDVGVNSFDEYPDRLYHIMGVIEAGYSPSETIDYVMTDVSGFSQEDWAKIRSVSQSTVSGNAAAVRRSMFDFTK